MALSVWHAKMRTPKVELLGGSTKQLGDSIAICPAATYIYIIYIYTNISFGHPNSSDSSAFARGIL